MRASKYEADTLRDGRQGALLRVRRSSSLALETAAGIEMMLEA